MWIKAETHDATNRCESPRVTCENHCRCDRISSLRSVAQIQTGLNLCDISQRQTKRKRLVAAAVQTWQLVAAICRIVCLGLNKSKQFPSRDRELKHHVCRLVFSFNIKYIQYFYFYLNFLSCYFFPWYAFSKFSWKVLCVSPIACSAYFAFWSVM